MVTWCSSQCLTRIQAEQIHLNKTLEEMREEKDSLAQLKRAVTEI